jgi:uncharacterized protein (UPF0332 family)
MATWEQMSTSCLKATEALARLRNRRSAISRAYYAAFAAVTGEIRKRTHEFPKGYEHPPHPQLGRYVKRHLTHMTHPDRDDLRDALLRLYEARLDADYRHQTDPTDADVRSAMADAVYVRQSVGLR